MPYATAQPLHPAGPPMNLVLYGMDRDLLPRLAAKLPPGTALHWQDSTQPTSAQDLQRGQQNLVLLDFRPEHASASTVLAQQLQQTQPELALVAVGSTSAGQVEGVVLALRAGLRDVLDMVHKRGDNLFTKFGGHAMAAGMTLPKESFPRFAELFEEAVKEVMDGKLSQKYLVIDGELPPAALSMATVEAFSDQVWGQGFEEPIFLGEFELLDAKLVGAEQNHLRMSLRYGNYLLDAMQFFCNQLPAGPTVKMAYKVSINEFLGNRTVNLMVVDKE